MQAHARIAAERLERAARLARDIARRGPSAERVHDLRGSCRRVEVVLRVYRDSLKESAGKKLLERSRKLLKKFRQRAGESRDATVAIELLERAGKEHALRLEELEPLLREQRRIRDEADDALRSMKKKARTLSGALEQLIEPVSRAGEPSRDELTRATLRVQDKVPKDLSDPDRLHALRLALKRLRFVAELFGEEALEEQAHALTDRLGIIQDLRVLCEWVSDRSCRLDDDESRHAGQRIAGALREWGRSQRQQALNNLRDEVARLVRSARTGYSRTSRRVKRIPRSARVSRRKV